MTLFPIHEIHYFLKIQIKLIMFQVSALVLVAKNSSKTPTIDITTTKMYKDLNN